MHLIKDDDNSFIIKTKFSTNRMGSKVTHVISVVAGEEIQLDSIYLRPGTTGEEQSRTRLPYLSKVSLFDGKFSKKGFHVEFSIFGSL